MPPRQLEPLQRDESDGGDSSRSKKKKKKRGWKIKSNKIRQEELDTPRQYDYDNSYPSKNRKHQPTIDEYDEDYDRPHRNWHMDLPEEVDPYNRRPNSHDDVVT